MNPLVAAAGYVVDFLRSLPHGDVWICLGVALAAVVVFRAIVKRIILIIVIAAALCAITWWLLQVSPADPSGARIQQAVLPFGNAGK